MTEQLHPITPSTELKEPLPLWRAMERAGMNESGTPQDAIAAEIEALANWLVPFADALPINELAEAQQDMRQAIRVRLLQEARIARLAADSARTTQTRLHHPACHLNLKP